MMATQRQTDENTILCLSCSLALISQFTPKPMVAAQHEVLDPEEAQWTTNYGESFKLLNYEPDEFVQVIRPHSRLNSSRSE